MTSLDTDAVFAALDEEIAELSEARAGCRRAVAASRAAVIVGALAMLLALPFPALRAPGILLASFAAVIGGLVWAGASKSSGDEIAAKLADAEARKEALIDRIAAANGWRDLSASLH